MLTLEITKIHNDSLKKRLKDLGLCKKTQVTEVFKNELSSLVTRVNAAPSEDEVRNRIKEFFVSTNVSPTQNITFEKDNIDLLLKTQDGKGFASIIEVKHPSKPGMLKENDGNRKALHELVWYFLNEVFDKSYTPRNKNIKTLVASDGLHWFVFSGKDFYAAFGCGKVFEIYKNNKNGEYATKTDDFYKEIQAYLNQNDISIPCVYLDLSQKYSANDLSVIRGVLSQQYLIGGTIEKDSNDINNDFYNELLHIMGLQEYEKDHKKIITRCKNPDKGSLLELALEKLDIRYDFSGTLHDNLDDYGKTKEERLVNVAIELCLIWVNRVLFLKLLETLLRNYKSINSEFLNVESNHIPNFQTLNNVFFNVLGKRVRSEEYQTRFSQIPYLNSSLFERSDIEKESILISDLDDKELKLYSRTILKKRKKNSPKLRTIEYLFEFLSMYKFGDGDDCTINASVLGKVFEKINGYKEGSVYTPGFVSFAMCKNVIDAAVLRKFSKHLKQEIHSIDDLKQITAAPPNASVRQEYIGLFNSVTLCDLSVGSGHYLVSALNYFIYLKWYLYLFFDSEGTTLRRFTIECKDDLLKIYYGARELAYDPKNAESQLLQETVFAEKKRLLENCLFGVDINPNSVNICRLRLWIELLKSSYYKKPDLVELQTLPNIDLNIKQGDSLLSMIPVKVSTAISQNIVDIPDSKIREYRRLVKTFKNTDDKDVKLALENSIKTLKKKMRGEVELYLELTATEIEANEKMEKIRKYSHAMEWMFEFPELIDDRGRFVGFDIVVGNPPYIPLATISESATQYGEMVYNGVPVYSTFRNDGDISTLFVERAYSLVNDDGVVSYIMPNKWMTTAYGRGLRKFFLENGVDNVMDFGDAQVFPNVTTYTCIFSKYGKENRKQVNVANVKEITSSKHILDAEYETFTEGTLTEKAWVTSSLAENRLYSRLESVCTNLGEIVGEDCKRGIQCGCVSAFLVSKDVRDRLVREHSSANELLKPLMKGDGQIRWREPSITGYLIAIPKGFSYNKYGIHDSAEMWELFKNDYPSIANWLDGFEQAKTRGEKGDFWWELRACNYYSKFSEPRIMYQKFPVTPCFVFSDRDLFCDDSVWMINAPNKALLTILNSKMGWWLIGKACPRINGGHQLIWQQFKNVLIPRELPNSLVDVAEQILEGCKRGADTKELEQKAEKLVYSAYGLSPEEIDLVNRTTDWKES